MIWLRDTGPKIQLQNICCRAHLHTLVALIDWLSTRIWLHDTGLTHGFDGFRWVSMGFDGFRWVLMGFDGFRWVLMGFDGFRWVLMGFDGFRWVSMGSDGFWWFWPDAQSRVYSFRWIASHRCELKCFFMGVSGIHCSYPNAHNRRVNTFKKGSPHPA